MQKQKQNELKKKKEVKAKKIEEYEKILEVMVLSLKREMKIEKFIGGKSDSRIS